MLLAGPPARVPNGADMSATETAASRPLTVEERVARRQQPRSVWQTRAGKGLAGAALVLLGAPVVGLVLLWPHGRSPHVPAAALAGSTNGAEVVSRSTADCGGSKPQRFVGKARRNKEPSGRG